MHASEITSGSNPRFFAMVAKRESAISFTAVEYLSSIDLNEIQSDTYELDVPYVVRQDLKPKIEVDT